MNPDVFRRFAHRCRELMLKTRTEAARRELLVWAERLEAEADAMDRENTAAGLHGLRNRTRDDWR
jgi:hypothetical protein